MRNLFKPVTAQSKVDDLYNGTLIPRNAWTVTVSGTGIMKRGTPLTSDDGETFTVWEPGEIIRGILIYDIDTAETEEAANAVLGTSGEFNLNTVEEALGNDLTQSAIMEAAGKFIVIRANYKYPHADTYPLD